MGFSAKRTSLKALKKWVNEQVKKKHCSNWHIQDNLHSVFSVINLILLCAREHLQRNCCLFTSELGLIYRPFCFPLFPTVGYNYSKHWQLLAGFRRNVHKRMLQFGTREKTAHCDTIKSMVCTFFANKISQFTMSVFVCLCEQERKKKNGKRNFFNIKPESLLLQEKKRS